MTAGHTDKPQHELVSNPQKFEQKTPWSCLQICWARISDGINVRIAAEQRQFF
jgi:hypothetical protein